MKAATKRNLMFAAKVLLVLAVANRVPAARNIISGNSLPAPIQRRG